MKTVFSRERTVTVGVDRVFKTTNLELGRITPVVSRLGDVVL